MASIGGTTALGARVQFVGPADPKGGKRRGELLVLDSDDPGMVDRREVPYGALGTVVPGSLYANHQVSVRFDDFAGVAHHLPVGWLRLVEEPAQPRALDAILVELLAAIEARLAAREAPRPKDAPVADRAELEHRCAEIMADWAQARITSATAADRLDAVSVALRSQDWS